MHDSFEWLIKIYNLFLINDFASAVLWGSDLGTFAFKLKSYEENNQGRLRRLSIFLLKTKSPQTHFCSVLLF